MRQSLIFGMHREEDPVPVGDAESGYFFSGGCTEAESESLRESLRGKSGFRSVVDLLGSWSFAAVEKDSTRHWKGLVKRACLGGNLTSFHLGVGKVWWFN